MITVGQRRAANPVIVSADGNCSRLIRVPLKDRSFSEEWMQDLIRKMPDILPVEDLEPAFSPLICIGREVGTESGSIDNLYISPEGYLTIVETKLWRNPEARREVVSQIIDYAKALSKWSFSDLDHAVRNYTASYSGKELGVIEVLREANEDLADEDEARLIDLIIRNMRQGRFLLLIVGDGIREGVEEMVEFLSTSPQVHFSLALIELQVYQTREGLLLLPQLVTRTKEVVRAVVLVEDRSKVVVSMEPELNESKTGRITLSTGDFFNRLETTVKTSDLEFIKQVYEDMQGKGLFIQRRKASLMVRLYDPSGSGRKLTFFGIDINGNVLTGWLDYQLREHGYPLEIFEFFEQGLKKIYNVKFDSYFPVSKFKEGYPQFSILLDETIAKIKIAASRDLEE